MAMLTLNGVVQNVLHIDARTDKKTGEIYPAKDQVQIMAENTLPNGERRFELLTLSTDQPDSFRKLLGRFVSVPVGVFGTGVTFYALKKQAAPQALADAA